MKNRRYDYDVLRVCSMLGVIYLHVAAGALRSLDQTILWNFSNLLACLATPAVPLFFMMSGALLLGEEKTADLGFLFRRRIPRVLVPLLVYSAVTLLYSVVRGNAAGALEGLSRLLNTPVSVPYWFLYALIPMYLISPLLKRMADSLSDSHWRYLLTLWAVLTLGLSTVRSFAPAEYTLILTEHWTLNLNMIGGYLGYFLLGSYLERRETLPSRKVLCSVIAGVLLLTVSGTRWDTYGRLVYSERFTSYLTLFTALLSSAIFLLAKACLRGREEKGRLLPLLSGLSFPVYLLHPLAIGAGEKLWPVLFGIMELDTIPRQLGFYGAVALTCILSAAVLASVPGVCFLFTGQSCAAAGKSCNLQAVLRKKTGNCAEKKTGD